MHRRGRRTTDEYEDTSNNSIDLESAMLQWAAVSEQTAADVPHPYAT